MSEKAARKAANKSLITILKSDDINYSGFSIMFNRFYLHYCMLLKIVYLKFQKKPLKDKIKELLEFQNEEIYTAAPMYMNLAINYWDSKSNISFFSKIHKKQKDIISIIKNMSWDLFHWSNTTLNYNLIQYKKADICIPLFYTADQRLSELIKLLKIHCVAIDKRSKNVYPFFDMELLEKVLPTSELKKYMNYESMMLRNKNRPNIDIKSMSEKLEKNIINLGIWK